MIKIDNVAIKSVSVIVPGQELICQDLGVFFGENEVTRIIKSSGISRLRISEKGQTSSDLCVEAVQEMVDGKQLTNIKAVIFVSQTPDYVLPATGVTLQNRLGLSRDIVTYDINSGCTGYVHGLFLASMLASTLSDDVLVCAGDTISKYISEKDRSLRLIMGDAGSATIVGPATGGEMAFAFYADGSRYDSLIIPAGGARTPATNENAIITERENSNWRSDQHLFMDGLEIMKFALSDVVSLVREATSEEAAIIDTYVFHQANKFIVDALAKNLRIPTEKIPLAVDGFGNTGSASIPLALCHCFGKEDWEGRIKNPGRSLLTGFGVGLTAATAMTDLSQTRFLPIAESRKSSDE